VVGILFATALASVRACSNLLVSPGATVDGSAILCYNADDTSLFGSVDLRPAANHSAGALRQVRIRTLGTCPPQSQ
jgi:dipeptidase